MQLLRDGKATVEFSVFRKDTERGLPESFKFDLVAEELRHFDTRQTCR